MSNHKPCPFCGCTDLKLVFNTSSGLRYGSSSVFCKACGTYGPQRFDIEEAWISWNSRKELRPHCAEAVETMRARAAELELEVGTLVQSNTDLRARVIALEWLLAESRKHDHRMVPLNQHQHP